MATLWNMCFWVEAGYIAVPLSALYSVWDHLALLEGTWIIFQEPLGIVPRVTNAPLKKGCDPETLVHFTFLKVPWLL